MGVSLCVDGDAMGTLPHDGIALPVNGRVNTDGKDVLVVLGEGAGRDYIAVGAGLAGVDVDDGDDAGGARLEGDGAGEVELVGEDVLVVGEGDDELHDELAAAGGDGAAGAPARVLPADAGVLLVEADDVFVDFSLSVWAGEGGVEVLCGSAWAFCWETAERGGKGNAFMTPRQSQPCSRLFAQCPAPPSPKSKACFR